MQVFGVLDCPKNALIFSDEIKSSLPLSHALNCAKLLHGRADISLTQSGAKIKCRRSFSTLRQTRDGISQETFIKDILGDEVNIPVGLAIFGQSRRINIAFFRKLEVEITHCIANHLSGNPLTSFLHLYRAIEKMAVAFPLIYISGQVDFERSIDNLKSYFDNDRGELSFARKFSELIADQSEFLSEYRIKFSTQLTEIDEFAKIVSEIRACCPGYIEDQLDIQQGEFAVEFCKVSSFIIGCRNRLFHFSNSGQRNFDIDKMGGVSELCRMLVDSGLHWLALSFDEVFRRQADRIVTVT